MNYYELSFRPMTNKRFGLYVTSEKKTDNKTYPYKEYLFKSGGKNKDWSVDYNFVLNTKSKENKFRKMSDVLIPLDIYCIIVSNQLKQTIEKLNTEVQFISVKVYDQIKNVYLNDFYIMNVLSCEEAICLHLSKYFIYSIDSTYNFLEYGIYEDKTNNKDLFVPKLSKQVFYNHFIISEKAKGILIKNKIKGLWVKKCPSTFSNIKNNTD